MKPKLLNGTQKQLNKVTKKLNICLENVIILVTALKKMMLKLLNGILKQLNKAMNMLNMILDIYIIMV